MRTDTVEKRADCVRRGTLRPGNFDRIRYGEQQRSTPSDDINETSTPRLTMVRESDERVVVEVYSDATAQLGFTNQFAILDSEYDHFASLGAW